MKSRRELRQNAVSFVYNYLMTNKTMDELIEDNRFSSDVSDYIGELSLDREY